jgi:zinc/manganese transport system substrate-binding protein
MLSKSIPPFLVFLLVIVPSCRQSEDLPDKASRIKILTTIPPLYSFTKNIVGDYAEVENLLPSGAGPHEYSFSPGDIRRIAGADVIIKNGVNLEVWLNGAIDSAGKKGLVVVDTSAGTGVVGNDPHIWLSPKRAIIQVVNIRDALMGADPEMGKIYADNADSYIKRLERLDRYIEKETGIWKDKEFVAFHSAFLYFTIDYGLKQVAVIQESPAKEPSPKHIGSIINTIKTKEIRSIFSEPQAYHKIVYIIARDLNLEVYNLDTLETGEFYPEWYEEKIRENINVLRRGLN